MRMRNALRVIRQKSNSIKSPEMIPYVHLRDAFSRPTANAAVSDKMNLPM